MTTDQLPGIPPLPKKRGRPATGKAKSAAERKAEQRDRLTRMIEWGNLAELDSWLETATPAQICEAFPLLLKSRPSFAVDAAERLKSIANNILI